MTENTTIFLVFQVFSLNPVQNRNKLKSNIDKLFSLRQKKNVTSVYRFC